MPYKPPEPGVQKAPAWNPLLIVGSNENHPELSTLSTLVDSVSGPAILVLPTISARFPPSPRATLSRREEWCLIIGGMSVDALWK